jgi:uncharacterized protein (DUF58 family)
MKQPRFLRPQRTGNRPDSTADGVEAVRVTVPTLVQLNNAAAGLRLHHGPIRAHRSGGYLSNFKGRGMEFDEVRPYMPGDDVRSLDWRVTARTGKTHTKLFREERERPVYVSVDYRQAMFFATRGMFKSVMAARLAALVAWSANRHGDRVGGQIFTANAHYDVKPRTGKQAVLHLFKRLADLSTPTGTPHDDVARTGSSLEEALIRLCRHARPGSLIFLLSDFRQLSPTAEFHLQRLARHCEVVLLFIYDRLESQLPHRGRYRLSDGRRELTVNAADERYRLGYQQKFRQRQEHLHHLALKYRMRLIPCQTTDDPVRILQTAR